MDIKTIDAPNGQEYLQGNMSRLVSIFAMYNNQTGYSGSTSENEHVISVSTLIKPIQFYLLKRKYAEHVPEIKIESLLPAAKGTAIHDSFARAIEWYGDKSILSENRIDMEYNGFTISGTYDFIEDNKIKDLKTTSSFKYGKLMKEKSELYACDTIEESLARFPIYYSYVLQLSMYRWLSKDKNLDPIGAIIFSLNDKGFEGYPLWSEMLMPLFSYEEVEKFLFYRTNQIKIHLANETLPRCTEGERILIPAEYKLSRYSPNTGKYRTVPNSKFNNASQFYTFVRDKGKVGDKEDIQMARYIGCEYCGMREMCPQYNELLS